MSEVSVLNRVAGVNGTGRKHARKAARKRVMPSVGRARRWITVSLGCGIPAFSLGMSSIGGRLVQEGHLGLGTAALVLVGTVLAVSLSHLAGAIQDITRSAVWQSWCLAVATDAALVLGELAGVVGFRLWVVPVVMWSVSICSAVLNCWAFLRCK